LDGIVGMPERTDYAESATGQMQTLRAVTESSRIRNDAEMAEDESGCILDAPQVVGGAHQMLTFGCETRRRERNGRKLQLLDS
jgi:hypothetical protein